MSDRWRVGHRRGDWLRSVRCVVTRHRWEWNPKHTQRVCHRCFTVVDL